MSKARLVYGGVFAVSVILTFLVVRRVKGDRGRTSRDTPWTGLEVVRAFLFLVRLSLDSRVQRALDEPAASPTGGENLSRRVGAIAPSPGAAANWCVY